TELPNETAAVDIDQTDIVEFVARSFRRPTAEIKTAVIQDMNVLAAAGCVLLHILDHALRIILGQKDVLIAEWREFDRIEHHARHAAGKPAHPTVASLIDANAVTFVRFEATTVMEPLNGPVRIVLCDKDVTPTCPCVRDRQSIKSRRPSVIA